MFLTKFHDFEDGFFGVASCQRIVWVAQYDGFDAGLVRGEIIHCLQGGDEIIVPIVVCVRLSDEYVDIWSSFDHGRKATFSEVKLVLVLG